MLDRIADDMKRQAERTGNAHRVLFGGLMIRYQVNGPTRRLALAREKVPPSPKECEIVARCFRLSEGSTWTVERKYIETIKKHLFVADLQWLAEEVTGN